MMNIRRLISSPKYSFSSLMNISPLDGRYQKQTKELSQYFSEYALLKYRVKVEIEWLKYLAEQKMIKLEGNSIYELGKERISILDSIANEFPLEKCERIKEIEKTTNHDVKAVEYFIKEELSKHEELNRIKEYVHFCCTSEDINNLAYSLMMKDASKEVLIPSQKELLGILDKMATDNADESMLSRTHGQTASPTTVGKEIRNFWFRLDRQHSQIENHQFLAKLNGAVGNFNAHMFVYPEYNWPGISQSFIEQNLQLTFNPFTTQIEPHDSVAEFYQDVKLFNNILLGFSKDLWHYISLGYFKLKVKKDEIGSSTMPHKVNPIDFENAEGNLGLSIALAEHMSQKLTISRYQRDLSDSTVMRNNGMVYGYSLLSYKSFIKGLNKLDVNRERLRNELDNSWEVLAEPIQMLMRKEGVEGAYEIIKAMTRGQKVTQQSITELIEGLQIREEEKQRLRELTVFDYTGNAAEMGKYSK